MRDGNTVFACPVAGNFVALKKYLKLKAAGFKSARNLNPPHVNV
jgi:hypothetical protein